MNRDEGLEMGEFDSGRQSTQSLEIRGKFTPFPPVTGRSVRICGVTLDKTRLEPCEVLARRREDVHSIDLPGVLGIPAAGRNSSGLVSFHTESSR